MTDAEIKEVDRETVAMLRKWADAIEQGGATVAAAEQTVDTGSCLGVLYRKNPLKITLHLNVREFYLEELCAACGVLGP